jgi:hypothetical protein
MPLRKILTVLTVLFLLTEPILASVTTVPDAPEVCVTCGMKGTCDLVCCCRPHAHSHMQTSPAAGLYPVGCHRDRDSASLELSNNPRWAPGTHPLAPFRSVSTLYATPKTFLSDSPTEVLTPPPNTGLLP